MGATQSPLPISAKPSFLLPYRLLPKSPGSESSPLLTNSLSSTEHHFPCLWSSSSMMSAWPAHRTSCSLPVSTLIGCADAWLVLQYFNCNSTSKYQINLDTVTLYSDNFRVSVGHKLGHIQLNFLLRVSKLSLSVWKKCILIGSSGSLSKLFQVVLRIQASLQAWGSYFPLLLDVSLGFL